MPQQGEGGAAAAVAGDKTQKDITQTSHGFDVQAVIYHTGSVYAKAKADAAGTLGIWLVSEVTDSDNFTLVQSGHVTGLSSLTAGSFYYVSEATAGLLTSTEPSSGYSNPVLFADTTTSGWVLPYRATELVLGSGIADPTTKTGDTIFRNSSGALAAQSVYAATLGMHSSHLTVATSTLTVGDFDGDSGTALTLLDVYPSGGSSMITSDHNRLTARVKGLYSVSFHAASYSVYAGQWKSAFYVYNSSDVFQEMWGGYYVVGYASDSSVCLSTQSALVHMDAGDYVQIKVWHDYGSNRLFFGFIDSSTALNSSNLSAVLLKELT